MPRPTLGQMERSYAALTVGVIRSMDDAKAQRAFEGLAEREEEIAIEISGEAQEFAAWAEITLEFDTFFVDATGQRDSDFVHPIFTYGAYIPSGGPVALSACVLKWITNKRNETTGCTLAVGVAASDTARKFQGELHAVFSGYGAPADDYGDMTSIDVQ
jgi:hypothetical protein